MSSAFSKVANVVQHGAVIGLLGVFGYHTYQIATNVKQGVQRNPVEEGYFDKVQEKVQEDRKEYGRTDKRDWYDKDDNSYLENVPRANKPGGAKK